MSEGEPGLIRKHRSRAPGWKSVRRSGAVALVSATAAIGCGDKELVTVQECRDRKVAQAIEHLTDLGYTDLPDYTDPRRPEPGQERPELPEVRQVRVYLEGECIGEVEVATVDEIEAFNLTDAQAREVERLHVTSASPGNPD